MILIYKMLLGVLVIAVILATLDRSILMFIEENVPIIKQQQHEEQEGFFNRNMFNRKNMNAAKNRLTNPKTRIKEQPPSPLTRFTSNENAVLRSLVFANPKKEFAVNNFNSFCNKSDNNLDELEKRCGNIDKDSCKKIGCCVLLNEEKCVSGGPGGPNFGWRNNNGETRPKRTGDYYYYQGKRYK